MQHSHKSPHLLWILHRRALLNGNDHSHHRHTDRITNRTRSSAHLDRGRGGELVGCDQGDRLMPQRRPDLRRVLGPARLQEHRLLTRYAAVCPRTHTMGGGCPSAAQIAASSAVRPAGCPRAPWPFCHAQHECYACLHSQSPLSHRRTIIPSRSPAPV